MQPQTMHLVGNAAFTLVRDTRHISVAIDIRRAFFVQYFTPSFRFFTEPCVQTAFRRNRHESLISLQACSRAYIQQVDSQAHVGKTNRAEL